MELQLYENFQHDLNELNSFEEFLNMENIIKRIETSSQYHRLCVSEKTKGRRFNPLMDLTETQFRRSYRFSKDNAKRLVEMLKDDLEIEQQQQQQYGGEWKDRKNQVPIEYQIMAAIRYWGGTEHPEITARIHGVTFRTLLKISKRVAEALSFKASRYIRMPCLLVEKEKVTKSFYDLAHMPQVIGAVAHTKVKCKRSNNYNLSPKTDDILHIQLVTDAGLKIRDLDCRFVSSLANPLTALEIFLQSRIKERFEQNEFRGRLLLGDNSLKCSSYLYTPVQCAITFADQAFNNALRLTSEPARHCLNLWRQRFTILDNELYGSLSTNRHTIVALVLLHNMAIEWNDPAMGENAQVVLGNRNPLLESSKNGDLRGRDEFIKNNFYSSIH